MKAYHIPNDKINEAIELANGLFEPVYDKDENCICSIETYNRIVSLQQLLNDCKLIDFNPKINNEQS